MDYFSDCQKVNDLIENNDLSNARNGVIKILDSLEKEGSSYDPMVNHLIRLVGLYPYLRTETADWQDRYVYESFKVDVGGKEAVILHNEQSSILSRLVSGQNLAISAPTSFGKSFVVDAFIAIKKPKNVVIIVPTIALTDETRRRLYKKFSDEYKIITTSEVELGDKNIFIFPQERAAHYVEKITDLDMLVVDEFYKASPKFDKERSASLLNVILKLGKKSKQKYFLAPNISSLNDNLFTRGMEFIQIDFNTVFLEKYDLFNDIGKDENKKSEELLKILKQGDSKSLIYAGTYSNIDKVSNLLIDNFEPENNSLLKSFEEWLIVNYDRNWHLTNLVKRGCGIHNGRLHRPLSQIQVKLFEELKGLRTIVSTSSIIEGVNTSAENVIIWKNKLGSKNLSDFAYKNIIGRSGRMFKHFIGKVYILEPPPAAAETQLLLEFPDELLGDVNEDEFKNELTKDQIEKITTYKSEMGEIFGEDVFKRLKKDNSFESSDSILIKNIAKEISTHKEDWNGLGYLNSENPDEWDRFLYKAINLRPGAWRIEYAKFVSFIKILSKNWFLSIPDLLHELDDLDIGVDDFFMLERVVSFEFSTLLNDINVIQKEILRDKHMDIAPFVSKASHAFLPPVVYQLEEYGLPRMISKRLETAGLIDFSDAELKLHNALELLKSITLSGIMETIPDLSMFDRYILTHFFDGISAD